MPLPTRVRSFLAAGALASLIAAGCSRNVGEPPADERPPALFRVEVVAAANAGAPPVGGVLYVGARPKDGGPPGYVLRQDRVVLPMVVDLTAENAMGPQVAAVEEWRLFVRLDRDGDVGTQGAGDWSGTSASVVRAGSGEIVRVEIAPIGEAPPPWIKVKVDGDAPPAGADMFVIVREVGGRVPLAARRLLTPPAWPVEVDLTERDLLRGPPAPPANTLEVLVKVDQDGDPLSTVEGDLEGRAAIVNGISSVRVLRPGRP